MNVSHRARRRIGRALGWTALAGLAVGLYWAYRWAEPSPAAFSTLHSGVGDSQVTIRLEKAPFACYSAGHKAWSLWAGRLDLERMPGAALANIQSATLLDIRKGILFRIPAPAASPGPLPASVVSGTGDAPQAASADGPPAATFRAGQGRYVASNMEAIPADLAMIYTLQWQFKLADNVDFRTPTGDHLQARALTILQLTNRRTLRPERRIVCDSGAQMAFKGVQVYANQVRYDPVERTVECLGGARGTFAKNVVQADRLFWSLGDQVLRCPEVTTGTLQGMPFTADGLTIDLKRRVWRANHLHVRFRMDEGVMPGFPSEG